MQCQQSVVCNPRWLNRTDASNHGREEREAHRRQYKVGLVRKEGRIEQPLNSGEVEPAILGERMVAIDGEREERQGGDEQQSEAAVVRWN